MLHLDMLIGLGLCILNTTWWPYLRPLGVRLAYRGHHRTRLRELCGLVWLLLLACRMPHAYHAQAHTHPTSGWI